MGDAGWSAFPAVAELVRAGRFDEALVRLYAEAERSPSDRNVTEAIERVREQMAESALLQLGSLDAIPRTTGIRAGSSWELGADERYLLGRVDGARTIDQLVRTSTLGRHRTSRVLVWLVSRGLVEIPAAVSAPRASASTAGPVERVVVGDGNTTQASLARTMLRVSLGRGVELHTVGDAAALLECLANVRPDLLVLDFRLPGRGDGLETLRAARKLEGLAAVPAIVVATRIEADYVKARMPSQTELLVRPIERGSLDAVLRKIVPSSMGTR